MINDQLSFISLTDLTIYNMGNVTSTRYSLFHIDEAMNDIITLIILNNYIIIYNYIIIIIYYISHQSFL